MNKRRFVQDASLTVFANMLGLVGSALITLLLPKFIGVEQYAYYQLYIFYIGYIGLLGIGWIEGIYLKYGGQYYDDLNKAVLSRQFRTFCVLEVIIGIIVALLTVLLVSDANKRIVFLAVAVCVVIHMPRSMLNHILQATGKIKPYANGIIIEKVIQIIGIGMGIFLKEIFFVWFVLAEIVCKIFATCYIIYNCWDIVVNVPSRLGEVKNEIWDNIRCGLLLVFSNFASMLIIGILRQGIEMTWGVEVFGKISLTLSVSNLLLVFINSVALVFFPVLKRQEEHLTEIYDSVKTILMVAIFFLLMTYYPMKSLLSMWLPQYAESLNYMAILFPLCVYESKMSLLNNTYMKVLRKEKVLMEINMVSISISLIGTFTICRLMKSLDIAMVFIVALMALRCSMTEIALKKWISIKIFKDILLEAALVLVFMWTSWQVKGIKGFLIYLMFYVAYVIVIVQSKKLKGMQRYIKMKYRDRRL